MASPIDRNTEIEALLEKLRLTEQKLRESEARANAEAARAKEEEAKAKEEQAIAKAALARANYEAAAGRLTTSGLPRIGGRSCGSTASSGPSDSRKSDSSSSTAWTQREGQPFGILHDLHLDALKALDKRSIIWHQSRATGLGWTDEQSICVLVDLVIRDVLRMLDLQNSVSIDREFTMAVIKELQQADDETKKNKGRSDFVLLKKMGAVMSVVEVKKPFNHVMKSWDFQSVASQIGDYLTHLRNYYGISCPMAIVTTYQEWRVYWLSASSDLVNATDLATFDFPQCDDFKEDNVLHSTATYQANDPQLIVLLASFLKKTFALPVEPPSSFFGRRRFVHLKGDHRGWVKLDTSMQLSLRFPPPYRVNKHEFIFLQDYHGGRDGFVWLAASNNYHLVVLKFIRSDLVYHYLAETDAEDRHLDQLQRMQRLAEAEVKRWKEIWGVEAFMVEFSPAFCRIPVFAMPFVFHGRYHCDGERDSEKYRFSGPDHWTSGSNNNPFALPKTDFSDTIDPSLYGKYLEDPLLALKEAALDLHHRGWRHYDIRWRHIGLMPVFAKASDHSATALRPIWIDLTDVRRLSDEEKRETDEQVVVWALEGLRTKDP